MSQLIIHLLIDSEGDAICAFDDIRDAQKEISADTEEIHIRSVMLYQSEGDK